MIFVDSWAWVALFVADDANHAAAQAVGERIQNERLPLLTSDAVLIEALTRLRRLAGLAAALRLATMIDGLKSSSRLREVYLDQPTEAAALAWFRRFDDQDFSFTDCTSFAVMAREGIQEAFTADRHFAVAGFTPSPALRRWWLSADRTHGAAGDRTSRAPPGRTRRPAAG